MQISTVEDIYVIATALGFTCKNKFHEMQIKYVRPANRVDHRKQDREFKGISEMLSTAKFLHRFDVSERWLGKFKMIIPTPLTDLGAWKVTVPETEAEFRQQEIVEMARELKLGTNVRDNCLLLQKVWNNPAQVIGFEKIQAALKFNRIDYSTQIEHDDNNCCYIVINRRLIQDV